jgi:hypothetical protein
VNSITSRVDIPVASRSSIAAAGSSSAQPLSAMSVDSSDSADSASPSSSWSSVLGKRKKEEPPDNSLSSRKSARFGDAKIRIHSIVGASRAVFETFLDEFHRLMIEIYKLILTAKTYPSGYSG